MKCAALLAGLVLALPAPAGASSGYLHVSTAENAARQYADAHAEQMHALGGFGRCRRRLTARAVDCWAGYQQITDETGTYDFYERVTVRLGRRLTVTSALYDEPPFVVR